jgi:hypothetical protein
MCRRATETGLLAGDGRERVQQVAGGSRRPVEPRHGHHVAGGKVVEHLAKLNTPLRHKLRATRRSYGPANLLVASPRASRRASRPHIRVMKPDLSDDDMADLAKLIKRAIDASRYPFSPEVSRWKELLAKLRPEPVRKPLPPPATTVKSEPGPGRQEHR